MSDTSISPHELTKQTGTRWHTVDKKQGRTYKLWARRAEAEIDPTSLGANIQTTMHSTPQAKKQQQQGN